MPAEIVHPITADLLQPMYASAMRAYLGEVTTRALPWRQRAVDLDRAWIARDADRVVGTLRTIADTMSVPGRPDEPAPRVDADLLSLVSVSPTHRRQGLLRQMLSASLTEAHGRGEAVSLLVAAEYQIYGRFGYAPAVFETRFDVQGFRPGARVTGDPVGSMREIDLLEASELAPPVYTAEADARAGLPDRDELWWDRDLCRWGEHREYVEPKDHLPTRHAVHLDPAGTVDGYVRWSVQAQDEGATLGTLHVNEVLAATPVAYRELWRFLLGIDLVDRLDYPNRPVDDPLPWLLADARTARVRHAEDAMWLRILDVPKALTARAYGVEDDLVLEVVDPAVGGFAAGRWRLTAGPDGAQCVPASDATPDLTLPQASLASVYLGGVRGAVLARAGGFDEHTPGAGVRFDRLFATPLAPWRGIDF